MKKAKRKPFLFLLFLCTKSNVKQLKNFKYFLIFFYCISPDFHYNGGVPKRKIIFYLLIKRNFLLRCGSMEGSREMEKEYTVNERIKSLHGKLIVSCQALPEEPLHSSFIMGRMARAAKMAGAGGIRANTKEDITEIQKEVNLPIIGIVKRDYPDCTVYITPTMKEVDELMETGVDIIALDATGRKRPGGKTLESFFKEVKEKYPEQLFMADCSTVEEAITADRLGFDFIGSTMVGYTEESKGDHIEADDFLILRKIIESVKHPVIAEGNINTPEKAKRVMELGAFSVVVGSIITRPQLIAVPFVKALKEWEEEQ